MYNVYFMLNFLSFVLMIILVLVGVAYLTLLERKLLGYVQVRKGPNKVGIGGILQPFSEAVKLISKEVLQIFKVSNKLFFFSPVVSMFMMLVIWVNYPYVTNIYYMNYSILLVIVILSLNSYVIMLMGWSSNSLYSMIGSVRSIVQVLSYEVSFILIILVQLVLSESYSVLDIIKWQMYLPYSLIMMPLVVVFFISMLAELNRSPMDFIEGESELVSGFNVEYFGGGFVLVFLAEYGMIIFMSLMFVFIYMFVKCEFVMVIIFGGMVMGVVFMRGILPRMRYDEMMYLCWKIILFLTLSYLFIFIIMKILHSIVI